MLPFCRCRRLSLVLEVRGGRSCGALKVSHLPFANSLVCRCLDESCLRLVVLEGLGVEKVYRECCRCRVVAGCVEVLKVLPLMCSARSLVIVFAIGICKIDSPLSSLAGAACRDHTFTRLPFT